LLQHQEAAQESVFWVTPKMNWIACLYSQKGGVTRLPKSIIAIRLCNEGLCLHQSKAFCSATRGSTPPLVLEEMTVGSPSRNWDLWWQKSGTSCWKQSWLGWCLQEAGLCFGSKQL
jgi:hypothetical protein